MPAPIALFVYNRPVHTRKTVEALLRNDLAAQSDLFVFSDAPKTEAAARAVEATRAYVRTIRGFRSVTISEREANAGLATSIIGGVTRLCEEFGDAIVMEDDLLSSPHFLRFMNDALDLYRDEPRVMHVSGSTYPVRGTPGEATYFLHLPLCWGWATWQRAWREFEKDISVMDRFDRPMVHRFNFNGTYDYWAQLELNRKGAISTWFVFWYATLFLKDALSLFPSRSMVRNIGMDGSGVHGVDTSDFNVDVSRDPIGVARIPLDVSRSAMDHHQEYFRRTSTTSATRDLSRRIRRIARRLWNGTARAAGLPGA